MAGGVKLLGNWASPFALRVRWALELKGIKYEYHEEDLTSKSALLLQYNPIHKKVPVLVHDGKVIVESLVILEYIEETWKNTPLLPDDPYERAMARFWVKFADDKCFPAMKGVFFSQGEEQQAFVKEVCHNLKFLDSALNRNCCFGVAKIGFVDVALAWIVCWAQVIEEIVGVKLILDEEMPSLAKWHQNALEAAPVLKECTPPREKLVEHFKGFRKMLAAASN
ncbi:PREDICTED: probable glutathione S-transferase [Ipomoea nil]|uniref:probable glutathione S-transferase n=1 Tax=Ipomoea nil TaxID=35883 RepID=UPI000900AC4A|nr:PREDICTED: probable glutathione S-transferase [Ipomoea nil]